MSAASEAVKLVPSALELVKLLLAGEAEKAQRKATAIAQALALRALGRATAKAIKK